jgi:glycosyltransferase involved in cell wall biosynthesis
VPPDPDQPGTDPPSSAGPSDLPGTGGTGRSGSVAPGSVAPGSVALVHDYLTQRGGAERVVLALATEYPAAPIHTSLYHPDGTFPEFAGLDVRTMALDRVALFRHHHRLALPLLAPAFSRLQVDAEVVICSSSGWAHGAKVDGRKVVYCHTPARWLYQSDRYLDGQSKGSAAALSLMAPPLRAWDRRAAASADRYLVNSTAVQRRVSELYGIDAEVVPPPVDVDPGGLQEPIAGLDPGFVLCVSRLLAYKNVEAVTAAFRELPDQRLVVVGSGPLADHIAATRPPNVSVLGRVTDANLRWLYASSSGLVAASYEDFGLTPVEAASFGRPTAALRWGGFLDTTVEGSTGVFFDEPQPRLIARAVEQMSEASWSEADLMAHARLFSPARFAQRIRAVVAAEIAAS